SSFRSTAIDLLLRLTAAKFSLNAGPPSVDESGGQPRMPSPPAGFSTLTTSAPRSASSEPANGPAAICPNSRTRTPASSPPLVAWSEALMRAHRPAASPDTHHHRPYANATPTP